MSAEGAKIFDIFVKTAIFYYDIWQRFIFEDLFLVITIKIRPKLGNSAQIRPVTKSPDLTVFPSLMTPVYLKNLIKLCEPSARYCLRRNCDRYLLVIPDKPRYKKMEGAFGYAAPVAWNNLPYAIRSISKLSKFKIALKTHFYVKAIGSNDEII